jgi:small multidrug resistance pump
LAKRRLQCPETIVKHWLFLSVAILSEVVATSALKASNGFARLWPTMLVAVGYSIAFYFLSLALERIPVGVAYAIWSGVGICLIAVVAWWLYGQRLDTPAIVGMTLITAGVLVLTLLSKSAAQ